ncbi:hypothetical protein BaRGS_00012959 [Batillaria attramentaria]|uniref:Uncharacterized protein n=1 Tax=Batillaria attramentaria TaxID=370345 RepID=A0ABD0L8K1_9CAEN
MGLLAFRYPRSFCHHHLRKSVLVLGLVIGPALLVLQYGFLHDKGMLNRERRRAMDDEVSSDVKCVLPDLNPFNLEVMRHYQKMPPVVCSWAMRDWVYTANGKFHISSAAREQYGPDITCKYIPIVRVSDYDVKDGSPINPMVDGANLTSDFFKVECASSSGKRYNNIHLAVARNKDIFHRLESYRQGRKPSANRTVDARETRSDSTGPQHTSKPLNMNVFIVGLDSMSRMSYMRNLPQVRHYFVNKMGAIELEGYNIVGDGTPAALLPILTGHTEIELPEARRGHEGAQPVDGHPWLYKDYVRHGYVTVHGEDSPGSGTFQYRMLGFKEQPTDHYMRTFYLAATPLFKDHLPLCLGSNPRHVSFMNWYRELFSMYRDYPKIFFGFHAELSHEHFNAPQVGLSQR